MTHGFKTFVVTYRHDGAEWHLSLPAQSIDDARRRLGQLALGRVDGELIASIPGALGPLAVIAAFVRNALASARA